MLTRALLFLLVCLPGAARAEALLEPKSTYAVIAGVLEWQERGLESFSKDKRKDQELYDRLAALGVPPGQMTLLLDQAATASAITTALQQAVARAPAGATLVFYYAGHGVKDNDGDIIFASADIAFGKLDASGLHLAALDAPLAAFKGKRLILLADCCYSGGLGAVAQRLARPGLQTLALTSAEDSNESTANWTFTQTIVDALAGRPLLDRNDNGSVTLAELHQEVAEGMRYREGQRSGWSAHGLREDVVVATAVGRELLDKGSGDFERRDWVLVAPARDQAPRVARILGSQPRHAKGEPVRLMVEFYDYATASRTWVNRADARPIASATWPPGTMLEVQLGRHRFDARVVRVDQGFMWVTYPGWGARWDEWITAARVVGKSAERLAKRQVQVEWRGIWYDAVVNSERDGQWCISYVGYGSEWDECVGKQRIRF